MSNLWKVERSILSDLKMIAVCEQKCTQAILEIIKLKMITKRKAQLLCFFQINCGWKNFELCN